MAAPGQALPLGTGSGDERFLAGGWGVPEPDGRWTVGGRSSIFLYVAGPRSLLDLELHGFTFLGSAIRPPRVRLLGNGRRLGALRFADSSKGARSLHVALPADTAGPHGELLLTFLLSGTRSPLEQGISEDTRRLGLFLTRLALRRRA